MERMETDQLRRTTRNWALMLTRRPSVTGTVDEATFGPWLAERLKEHPSFGPAAEIWTLPVAEGDGRCCVVMLIRGSGRRTVILTGHYDTVSIEDYGALRPLAVEPERLADALLARLRQNASSAAEVCARDDLASGEFLPGRGLLDMKAGLAAGLAAAEDFASDPDASGNLLFIAVPDEENASTGARRAARALPDIAASRDLDFVAAINLDAIADDGDGTSGRMVALGTIGKLLPTAFVVGLPTHAGFPLSGINAAALAAAIACEVEWAPELADGDDAQPGTPPSLLVLRDGKAGYDVTTPGTAFAAFNVLVQGKTPEQILSAFEHLCARAADQLLAVLRKRIAASKLPAGLIGDLQTIPVVRFETVEAAARKRDQGVAELDAFLADLGTSGHSLPEQSRLATERFWTASGLAGPAIVIGFGSIPYLSTSLVPEKSGALEAAVRDAAASASQRHATGVGCMPFFPGISDMSFFGGSDGDAIETIGRNMPVWRSSVRWDQTSGLAGIPTLNAGPWGRDYHTTLERLHVPYAFEVLPALIRDIVTRLLPPGHA